MRVAFDATSLLGARTGVGVVATEVLSRLARSSEVDVIAYAVTWRGRDHMAAAIPPGVKVAARPMAARPLRLAWSHADLPPIEWWTGRVDVVHGPNYVVPPTRGAATVVSVHDLTFVHHPEMCTRDTLGYPPLIRRAIRRGAYVHTGSHHVADEIRAEFSIAPDRVVVVPYGVNPLPTETPSTDAAAGRTRAGAERYVLALGTVEPRKDLPSLVAAFDELAPAHADVRLVIAGQDGWGRDALDAAIAASPHRDRIVRLGWVDDAARTALLRGATVYAYPSVYEGFGLPPLEAMAAGTPVVTTAAGSLPEVVADAALVVTPGDVEALAGALGRVLDDEALALDLRRRGYERCQAFTWDATAAGLQALYRQVDSPAS